MQGDCQVCDDKQFLGIGLLAILRQSLDRAIFSYIFIRKVRLNGVRASIAIVHIQKFYDISFDPHSSSE